MDVGIAGVIIAGVVPVLTAGVWLLRLEGRINAHEEGCTQRQKNHDERHVELSASIRSIDSKLDRLIERL